MVQFGRHLQHSNHQRQDTVTDSRAEQLRIQEMKNSNKNGDGEGITNGLISISACMLRRAPLTYRSFVHMETLLSSSPSLL